MNAERGFRLHPGAASDITSIWEFIAKDNPLAAKRSEEHTSELQSQSNLVCRLLLEKKTHHSHPGPHDRDHQQDEPPLAPAPAGDLAGARPGDARAEDGDDRGDDPQSPQNLHVAHLA